MDFDYQQHQRQQQQQQQWAPHLLQHPHSHQGQSAFSSPVSPPAALGDPNQNQYSYYQPNSQQQQHPQHQGQGQQQGQGQSLTRTPSSLSLSMNLATLSVASPTNLSPINPSPLHTHQPLTNPHGGHPHPGHHPGLSHSHSSSTISSTISPVTPISPGPNSFGGPQQQGQMQHGGHMQTFQFSLPDQRYDEHQFDMRRGIAPTSSSGLPNAANTTGAGTAPGSSRSSSSSEIEKSVPRKRSFSSNPHPIGIATPTTLSTNMEEGSLPISMYTPASFQTPPLPHHRRQQPQPMQMDVTTSASGPGPSYDDMDIVGPSGSSYTLLDPHASGNGAGNGSPIDGTVSPVEGGGSGCASAMGEGEEDDADGEDVEGEREDQLKPLEGIGGMGGGGMDGMGGMGILGNKAPGTNNFVAKLYQMISDPSSSRFISWTELGTSFVVSNVGEFSRSILGSHFKHNNFSSFVRQLNMYGFHKINRTPRSQRTSTDAQTWEFSHHKFLRGRPDLLDEIKRKALEAGPAGAGDIGAKHRVELPGEMMVMREENRRVWDALMGERRKVERLTGVVKSLWEVVGKGFPGSVPQFPSDLLEGSESPNIYITSPTSGSTRSFLPTLSTSISSQSLQSLHSAGSPASSPTTAEFSHHPHPHATSAPSLSRQHSYQQMAYPREATSTPLPASPGSGSTSMDLFEAGDASEGRASTKRQRTSNSNENPSMPLSLDSDSLGPAKRLSRARSDSAPLGYGLGSSYNAGWQQGGTRPRSGSGLAGRSMGNRPGARVDTNGTGNGSGSGTPLLSIPTLTNNSPGR